MTDRIPGAPGQYTMTVSADEAQKLLTGEAVTVTLVRNDQPLVEGTPYNKASVLPDDLATILCPNVADPTPADALRGLLPKSGGDMTGKINMNGQTIEGIGEPSADSEAATLKTVKSYAGGGKLLWTNTNPRVSFGEKTITINSLSDYDLIVLELCSYQGNERYGINTIITKETVALIIETTSSYGRMVKAEGTGIHISNNTSQSGDTNNSSLIPYRIYGIKNMT